MVKRLALSVFVAVVVVGINIPMPAIGSAPQSAGRVLINAPEMPAVDLTPPPLPAGAPVKNPVAPVKSGSPNHVSALSSDAAAKLRQQGLKVLDNREGLVRIEATVNGQDRVLTVVDGVLASGREVVGFGTAPAAPSTGGVSLIRALDVSANTQYFFLCSYAWMNSYWGDLHVHLCNVDATYIAAIITLVGATVGGLVGVFFGSAAGGVAGVAIGTIIGLLTIVYFWTHSDIYGNVDIVIPNWTMQPPYGGYILWADPGLWDYMPDQCFIRDYGWYYHPRCSY
jgi:hypothetical protein